jgi:RNA recognition motif-containing protein
MLKGLQKNPEKNGTIGTLVEFNKDKGRWVVALSTGNTNLKEENLDLMPDNSDIVDDGDPPPTGKIYITRLPAETTEKDLIDLFGAVGKIAKERGRGFEDQWPYAVKIYRPGSKDGDACVEYMDPQAAKFAIKTYHRFKFKGTRIGVAYAGQGRKYDSVQLQVPWHLRDENQGKLEREKDKGGS